MRTQVSRVPSLLAVLALLSGCTAMASRGNCEFMMQDAREQCLRANESSDAVARQKSEAKRDKDKPLSPADKDGKERDSSTDKWIP